MIQPWQPNWQYNANDTVTHQGKTYRIVQPHRSQSDWQPQLTPALWVVVDDCQTGYQQGYNQQQCNNQTQGYTQNQGYSQGQGYTQNQGYNQTQGYNQGQTCNQNQGYNQQPYGQQSYQQNQSYNQPAQNQSYNQPASNQGIPQGAQIIGGLVAAAGVIGGIAYGANQMNKKQQESRADHSNFESWVQDARIRSQQYEQDLRNNRQVPPVSWVLFNGALPNNVIELGKDLDGTPLYAARTFHKNGVHVGKFRRGDRKCYISWGGKEQQIDQFELLVGHSGAVRWVDATGKLVASQGRYNGHFLVHGGSTEGQDMWIAGCPVNGFQIGKAAANLNQANYSFGDKECSIQTYKVLAFA